ncbi:SH3 DOMAIN-CONTAINING PROTEIN 1 [Salix viminalis]|uniref:SH3 DOMAIN-CONTAINING PROTEIN 1 n=1 Tax=Salix viminalis TaxID=40686 RepID=A0A9Q0T7H2_SALVM|nr:SH3 DOMAIN-CONTAINING PROTEIN 1 [Salix viminalis]
MEAFKKQATRLREQVAKQQQEILKHLGRFSNEGIIVDEAELQCNQHLQNLYNSTRTAKHFQKNIVRGVEGFVYISSKEMEILRKLADECCKYGSDNQNENNHVARAALQFGASHNLMENEKETLVGVLNDQVSKPLRELITGAPLEDARHMTHHYDKLRQLVEVQAAEVLRHRSKTRDSEISAESCVKLRAAEARLTELKSTIMSLGREATAAMSSVENQQQQITLQRLFSMVDAERCYHQHVLTILDKLHAEMILEEQLNDSSPPSANTQRDMIVPPVHENNTSNGSRNLMDNNQKDGLFIAKVIHSFDAQAEGELSLSVDDFVVVRQVAQTGWSEGERRGEAGWFPSAYIEKHENSPASKIMEESSTS